jgi:hypothetical protein
MHVYVLTTGAVARLLEWLKVKLWRAGTGFCKVATPNAQTGVAAIVERALVDLTVFSPERLDFVAGALIAKSAPFSQDRPAPTLYPGGYGHYNDKGHRVVAEEVLKALDAYGRSVPGAL